MPVWLGCNYDSQTLGDHMSVTDHREAIMKVFRENKNESLATILEANEVNPTKLLGILKRINVYGDI